MEDIERLCKRIIIIRDGCLIFDGSLESIVNKFAHQKIITIKLKEKTTTQGQEIIASQKILSQNRDEVRIQVATEQTQSIAQQVFATLPVADLSINDVDITSVIEQIFSENNKGNPQ